MKLCAYCKNILGTPQHAKTDEHIIPASLINLFPEQDITYNCNKIYVDNRGVTISDVCQTCNNGFLSALDSYGKNIITEYFYKPFEYKDYNTPFSIKLDSDLFTRWILKIIYNEQRSNNIENSVINSSIPFIRGLNNQCPNNISIFLGIHINLNPIPEEYFSYWPLQINKNLIFEYFSFSERTNTHKRLILPENTCSYAIRFASCIVLVILWDDIISQNEKENIVSELITHFRFTELHSDINQYTIRCVSSPENVWLFNYRIFFSESAVHDTLTMIKKSIQNRDIGEAQKDFCKQWTKEFNAKGRALNELSLFPDNAKKKKQYEKYWKKKE